MILTMPQKSAKGKVGHVVGEAIEALQKPKTGNGERRRERYPARGIKERASKRRDS